MKKFSLSTGFLLLIFLAGMAQDYSRGFNFQGVARNTDGTPKANDRIEIIFAIFPDDNQSSPALYREKQSVKTDQFGVFSTTIGVGGTVELGDFSEIPFQDTRCELAVWQEEDGYAKPITRTKLLSVPYAKTSDHTFNADTAQHAVHAAVASYATQAFFPAGIIVPFAGDTTHVPAGWMFCDGRELNRNGYSALFGAIDTYWGAGNGSTTFNIPDLRGLFPRGAAMGSSRDPNRGSRTALNPGGGTGDNVGSYQGDLIGYHKHPFSDKHNWDNTTVANSSIIGADESAATPNNLTDNSRSTSNNTYGGSETRPKNVYVNYIIKL